MLSRLRSTNAAATATNAAAANAAAPKPRRVSRELTQPSILYHGTMVMASANAAARRTGAQFAAELTSA